MFIVPVKKKSDGKGNFAADVVAIVSYAIFILIFQYSKHKWKISQPDNWWEWLSVFHAELSIFLIVITLFISIHRLRNYLFFILTCYYWLAFLDYASWMAMSRPFHPIDISRAIEFVQHYPEFVKQDILKSFVILILPIILIIFRRYNPTWIKSLIERFFKKGLIAAFICVYIVLFPIAASSHYLYYNSLVKIADEIFYEQKLKTQKVTTDELNLLLGKRAKKNDGHNDDHNAPRKLNIIFFIIETGPYKYYHNFAAYLKANGYETKIPDTIAFSEHFSTYPESDRAYYSILNGKYPPLSRGTSWIRKASYRSALPNTLKKHGYKTYLLSTDPLYFQDNREMMIRMGFDRIIDTEKAKKALTYENGKRHWDRKKLYDADLDIVSKALELIQQHSSQTDSPYFLTLLPQSSHAPLQRPPGVELPDVANDELLMKANAVWQFRLASKIIDQLHHNNEFKDVLFLITGDHGIRSSYESEELFSNPNILKPITFHVPLWIMGKGVKNLISPTISTSHVDIAPTILELLGIDYDPDTYHGRSMTIKGERSIFFLGGDYLPVSGYKHNDLYFMENRLTNTIDVNNVFHFPSSDNKDTSKLKDGIQDNVSLNLSQIKSLLLNDPDLTD